jgi:exodeoxyribonuclease-3
MQETHFSQIIENELIQDFKGSLYQSNGTSNSRGVAIWIKKNVEFKLIDEYRENEGRLLLIKVEINNAIYTIKRLIGCFLGTVDRRYESLFNFLYIMTRKMTS